MTHRPSTHPHRFGPGRRPLLAVALATASLALSGCFTTGIKKLPPAFSVSEASLKELAKNTADNAAYDPTAALQLFDAGVAISDRSFDEFFQSFDTFQRNIAHNQTASNIVASTAVGVLGFTGATSKTLGIIGIAQAGANAEFKNFEGVYLLSPALDVVYKKLTETRRTYAAHLRAGLAQAKTFGQVRAMITEYHATGSLIAIRGYIRQAADIAKFDVVNSGDVAADTATQIEFAALTEALTYSAAAGTSRLSGVNDDIAFLLYLKTSHSPLYDQVRLAALAAAATRTGATPPAGAPSAPAIAALSTGFGPLLTLANDAVLDAAIVNPKASLILSRLARTLDFEKRVAAVVAALNPAPAGATTPPPAPAKTLSIKVS